MVANKIQDILESGMNFRSHWYPEDVSISDLAETFVGMANSRGGVVLLGIAPRSSRILGLRDPERLVDKVFQAALITDPPLILPNPQIEVVGKYRILSVIIPEGLPYIYSLDGRYLKRIKHQNIPLKPKEIRALLMARGVVQFESRIPPGATMDDLDHEKISVYRIAMERPESESLVDFLLHRACLRIENKEIYPTYAAVLLFGKNPQRWVPNGSILAARFSGLSYSDEFLKQEIRGTLPDQIRQAETFVRSNISTEVKLIGLTRQEIPEYPTEAFRELLVNAVAHRDYNIGGDCIQLHMFRDRLEVHSPGKLPGPVNLDNLLEARFSRNAVITQVLSDMGFVERLGYGLNRVVSVMERSNLPTPSFEEVGGKFRVTLQNAAKHNLTRDSMIDLSRYQNMDLNSRQEKALEQLIYHGRITNRAYQKICPQVSQETLRRDLVDMVKKGLLIKIGDKKATYYILKEQHKSLDIEEVED